jgi:hypothetical protein
VTDPLRRGLIRNVLSFAQIQNMLSLTASSCRHSQVLLLGGSIQVTWVDRKTGETNTLGKECWEIQLNNICLGLLLILGNPLAWCSES